MGFVTPLYSSVGSYYHVWNSPLVVSLLWTSTVLSVEHLRLRASIGDPVSSLDAPLLMIRSLHYLFELLDLLSGEGALTHERN